MRKTAIIQISIALILSLVAGVLVFKWMNVRLGAKQQEDASSQVTIIVAAKNIAKGEKLTEELLKQARFLKENAPSGTYEEIETLTNRVAASPIGEGEAITTSRLVSDEAFAGISTLIAPGKRAVAVKGNKVLGISGFVRPGDRVDVLVTADVELTGTTSSNRNELSFSKTVLENIKVIATGTELEPVGDSSETQSVDVYTLEMSSEECERLALASFKGTLHFALRNPAEDKDVRTQGIDIPKLMSSLKQSKSKKARTRYVGVEVITGTDSKTVRFARHDK